MGKGFPEIFNSFDADAFCLQEIKLQEVRFSWICPATISSGTMPRRRGYSGTAIFTRHEPLSCALGIGVPELDTEGRS